ncbi:MAG: DUF4179 domain-containing protein [Oscillospiraceae bacterium]|nr:DUF4179 domain-containing protein [Oscillospiraceae bacterium]
MKQFETREETLIYEVLSSIETPEFDVAAAVAARRAAPKTNFHPLRRGLVLALAGAVLVLSVGAAAVAGIHGMWGAFYGPIPTNAVSTVGISQTAGGYTLTVEDAIVDSNAVMLLLSLRRVDGGILDPKSHLRTNSLDVKLLADGARVYGSGGFEGDGQYSKDGRVLYFCYEFQTNGQFTSSLLNKPLTLIAEGVGIKQYDSDGYQWLRGQTPVSLAPLAEEDIPVLPGLDLSHDTDGSVISAILQATEGQDFALSLPMADTFPLYTVEKLAFTDDGPVLVFQEGAARNGELLCTGVQLESLVDIRDGTRYSILLSRGAVLPDGTVCSLACLQDCPLTVEDLPYLELEVSYIVDQILSEEPFALTFSSDHSSTLTLPICETITLADTVLHPTEIRLSALGIRIYFEDGEHAMDLIYRDKIAPVLTFTDGSVLETQWHGGYGSSVNTCSIRFSAKDMNGNRIFFDTSSLQSVSFGDLVLTIPQNVT